MVMLLISLQRKTETSLSVSLITCRMCASLVSVRVSTMNHFKNNEQSVSGKLWLPVLRLLVLLLEVL